MAIITHTITSCTSAGEYSSVELLANTKTGETELVIQKTIIERYPITDYHMVMNLHESINKGGGRRLFKLADLK